jgi:DNA-binding transcriptional MerR regulator/methylmalonyl-CoA mutase cobalamin-binding subunit
MPKPNLPTDHASERPELPYSIGDVAELTGLSPDTIRVWERRYGRPVPIRLPSGHRRYTAADVRWIRRVSELLAVGHRPSELVELDDDALDRLRAGRPAAPEGHRRVEQLMQLVDAKRYAELHAVFEESLALKGPRRFLDEVLAPFLAAIGRAWSDGRIQIRHEHLVSELVADLLRRLRSQWSVAPDRPPVLLTTLAGEQHGFGVQMVSLVCAIKGRPTAVLGVDTPIADIAHAAVEMRASAVGISVSLASAGYDTDRRLKELRESLPHGIPLVVGGSGASATRRKITGIRYCADLGQFEDWLERHG